MDKLRKVKYTQPGKEAAEGYFHGFFPWQDGDEAGPIALIESKYGMIHEVLPKHIMFLTSPEDEG